MLAGRVEWTREEETPDVLVALLPAVMEACLRREGLEGRYVVGLRWTTDAGIRILNRETRGLDAPTDVLSFPSVDYPSGRTAQDVPARLRRELEPETGELYLGDIAISWERARAQAEAYGHTAIREGAYLFAHGMFHLMGYDHETGAEREAMRAREEDVMKELSLSRETGGDELLLRAAREARRLAYAPYSNYAVGACLMDEEGHLYTGCNVENAAYGMCICAERTALCKAVSMGARRFTAIAVAAQGEPPFPCGACRQMLYEFAPDLRVLVTWGDQVREERLGALLPHGFGGMEGEI